MKNRALMVVLALGLVLPAGVRAQDEDEETSAGEDESGWGEGDEGGGDEEQAGDSEGEDEEGADEGDGGDEEAANGGASEEARNWYFGLFGRYVIVPAFMVELFLEQAPTLGNGSIGIIADRRTEDGPTLEIGIGYTGYQFDGPMQAKGDPETDTEWVESDLGLIHLTGSVLWNTELAKGLAFEYGVGLDFGILIGDLKRTEAYKDPADDEFHKCAGPTPGSAFCEFPQNVVAGTDSYDEEGAHYNVIEKRVPPVGGGFMLPHLALRWEPAPEVALKLEAAYGIVQFWFGLSAAYAPKI